MTGDVSCLGTVAVLANREIKRHPDALDQKPNCLRWSSFRGVKGTPFYRMAEKRSSASFEASPSDVVRIV